MVVGAEDRRLAITDPASPSAPPAGIPSPLHSPGGELRSPGAAPLLPPEGLPTAPPPDKIKPMEPQADPAKPKADPAAAEVNEDDASFRYLAVLPGACDGLTVADHAVPECAGKLVNVDFGNGRVAFLFTGREGDTNFVTTFSGGASKQPENRVYHLTVDRMSTTTVDGQGRPVTVVSAVEGDCTMRGDPTREQTHFACRVSHAGANTSANFHSTGTPEVYAGDASPDAPDRSPEHARQQHEYIDGFQDLVARDRFPRTVTQ